MYIVDALTILNSIGIVNLTLAKQVPTAFSWTWLLLYILHTYKKIVKKISRIIGYFYVIVICILNERYGIFNMKKMRRNI